MEFILATNGENDPDFLHNLHFIVLIIILTIVSAHHVLSLCYELLHWPAWLVNFYEQRKKNEIAHVLEELGLDDAHKRNLRLAANTTLLNKASRHSDPRSKCLVLLRNCFTYRESRVGKTYTQTFSYFVDVMSDSLDPAKAEAYAEILASYLKSLDDESRPVFNHIIGLKQGSPILAAAFANKMGLPLSLFRGKDDYKFNSSESDYQTLFDGPINSGSLVLIIDDSTTGGRKVIDCKDALEKLGVEARSCLVLFEPKGKKARETLRGRELELFSVVSLNDETITKLSS